MKEYYLRLRSWYNKREMRERLLFIALSWAVLYFLFYYLLTNSIDFNQQVLLADINQKQTDITNTQKQIDEVKAISQTRVYKEWQAIQAAKLNLETQHLSLSKIDPAEQWQTIVNVILKSQPNIGLVSIKNLPEREYNPLNITGVNRKIFAQTLQLTVESDYFDFLQYMRYLERELSMVHWDKLNYEVVQYPLARINMEFSILYEKADA